MPCQPSATSSPGSHISRSAQVLGENTASPPRADRHYYNPAPRAKEEWGKEGEKECKTDREADSLKDIRHLQTQAVWWQWCTTGRCKQRDVCFSVCTSLRMICFQNFKQHMMETASWINFRIGKICIKSRKKEKNTPRFYAISLFRQVQLIQENVVTAVTLSSTKLYSNFQLIVFDFMSRSFTILVQHCSHQPSTFSVRKLGWSLPAQHQTPDRQSYQLVNEHSGAFSSKEPDKQS